MLYNCENPILHIVGVEHMRWSGGRFVVAPRSFSALAFRISGNATIDSGGEKYFVNTNDILYLPQNMSYTASYTDTELLVIHFVTARADSQVEIYSLNNSEDVYKLFLQTHTLWDRREPGFHVYAMSRLYKILGTILEKETKANLPQHLLKAVSYMNANYKDSAMSIRGICDRSGISETTFRQLFSRHYQKSPVAYITDLRLEYARNLISGGMSIENAALESGFNDPKYFARVVKKQFGCTPRELKTFGK